MKLFYVFLIILLSACTPVPPFPPPELPEPSPEPVVPRVYEMRLVRADVPSHVGSGTIVTFNLRPAEILLQPGETVAFTNAGPLNEKLRLVAYKRESGVSKFSEVHGVVMHHGDSFTYTFTEPGEYRVLCLFNGCVGKIIVSDDV